MTAVLTHHRAYRSVHGGLINITSNSILFVFHMATGKSVSLPIILNTILQQNSVSILNEIKHRQLSISVRCIIIIYDKGHFISFENA